jgi:hypothetical protein
MKKLALTLALCISLPSLSEQKPSLPSVKECLNDINTASGMAAEYSEKPFSRERLQAISNIEDKLTNCANLPNADAKLLYSLFDAELRLSGVKQVWLVQTH